MLIPRSAPLVLFTVVVVCGLVAGIGRRVTASGSADGAAGTGDQDMNTLFDQIVASIWKEPLP